jgi:hypothetical protein
MAGGVKGGCFASVTVSAATPALSKQAGQKPASTPVGNGVPHRGHLFPSGIGASISTVSTPPSEAKAGKRYRKFHDRSRFNATGTHP